MLSSLYFDSLRLETRLQLEELMKLICLRWQWTQSCFPRISRSSCRRAVCWLSPAFTKYQGQGMQVGSWVRTLQRKMWFTETYPSCMPMVTSISGAISQNVKKDTGFMDAPLESTSNYQVIQQVIRPVIYPVIHQVIKQASTHHLSASQKSLIIKVKLVSRNTEWVLNRKEDVATLCRFLFTRGRSGTKWMSPFTLILLYLQLDWGIIRSIFMIIFGLSIVSCPCPRKSREQSIRVLSRSLFAFF